MARAAALLLVLLSVAMAGCGRDTNRTAAAPATTTGVTVIPEADRVPAPRLAGRTLEDTGFDSADLRGRPVVVNAWASWCEPCREETPVLVRAAERRPGVAFVGLNVQDRPAAAGRFAADLGIVYPSLVDPSAALLARIPGVPPKALPSTIAIDEQGRIAARAIGPVDDAMLAELIAAARR